MFSGILFYCQNAAPKGKLYYKFHNNKARLRCGGLKYESTGACEPELSTKDVTSVKTIGKYIIKSYVVQCTICLINVFIYA